MNKSPLVRSKTLPHPRVTAPKVDVRIDHELQCSHCKAIFPDFLARCPECGSDEWVGYTEVNPYTRLPMELFLKICGHILWLVGVVGFLVMMWETGEEGLEHPELLIYGAVLLLLLSIVFSGAYFGMSELMRRLLRVQRRLKAFHQYYNTEHNGIPALPSNRRHRPRTGHTFVSRVHKASSSDV